MLLCTMETLVSVPAVGAVKDDAVEVAQIISPSGCEAEFFKPSAQRLQ